MTGFQLHGFLPCLRWVAMQMTSDITTDLKGTDSIKIWSKWKRGMFEILLNIFLPTVPWDRKNEKTPLKWVSELSLHTWLSIETLGFIPNTKEIDNDMLRKRGKKCRSLGLVTLIISDCLSGGTTFWLYSFGNDSILKLMTAIWVCFEKSIFSWPWFHTFETLQHFFWMKKPKTSVTTQIEAFWQHFLNMNNDWISGKNKQGKLR